MSAFDVTVRTLLGQNHIIDTKVGETVGDLRRKIASLIGTAKFRIVYSGKNMEDDYVFTRDNLPCESFHIILPTKSMTKSMVQTWCVLGAAVVGAVVGVFVVRQLTRST
jgi:hypothetical protein